jgi:AAA domain
MAKALEDRASQLENKGTSFDPKLAAELKELEARVLLADGIAAVLAEVERKKRLAAYRQCIDDTSTATITRKSTELTKELVTDQLRSAFQDELAKLDFTHLALEVQPAGAAKGSNFHRLVFSNAPSVSVVEVLSEGESRTLSLAAFLTELSTASSQSAIIFDDPVSSLDHIWRERIARRIVVEAKRRQVIVFTHDLLFLRLLLDESAKQGVPCENQYVRREGQAGVLSPDLPWLAMPIKERIGKLRVLWQAAEKTHRTSGQDAYESAAREIYGFLREAWERAITEVLLNDVVERYRPSIETKKLRFLHDITKGDCETVEKEMGDCSRWLRGHDQAAADGTPVPAPAALKERIDELEKWTKAVKQRR